MVAFIIFGIHIVIFRSKLSMKKIFIFFLLLSTVLLSAQQKAYGEGEWLQFRVHYGLLTAGYANIEIDEVRLNEKQVYHVKGYGKTTGMASWFFKVEDTYQSYIDKDKDIPYRFIRKIDEGGYTKDIQIDFDHSNYKAIVTNNEQDTKEEVSFPEDAQDMVSALYYLRNNLKVEEIEIGEEIFLNMFFDKTNYVFGLKFLGREILDSEFGKVSCLIFRPYVMSGRVFKEKESLTIWVSDDDNKIPLLIKADLAVGSLKATLTGFKGLKHSFKIIAD